jgi:hypothetical protein
MEKITFEDLPRATEKIIENLLIIKQDLKNIQQNFIPIEPEELMTRNEVAEYFKINISTLWHWTKRNKLIASGIGARVYYKRSEVESSLIRLL